MAKKDKLGDIVDKSLDGLLVRTERYSNVVRSNYIAAARKLADIASRGAQNNTGVFRFEDFPELKAEADEVLKELYARVYWSIANGIKAEWQYANLATDNMIEKIFGKGVKGNNHLAQWFARNEEAMKAFIERRDLYNGMNLSQRIWKYVDRLQTEMEAVVSMSIGQGKSAQEIARESMQYLKEPNRVVKYIETGVDKDGNRIFRMDAASELYHPGRGVYRSSWKNAMRMARTETNMAYRASDNARWKQLQFVVGFEIRRSNHPYPCVICESLKGKYPKDFVFVGWHPQCRCHMIPILAAEDEFVNLEKNMMIDADVSGFKSRNSIDRMPAEFVNWYRDNKRRIERAASVPYWLRDNKSLIDSLAVVAPTAVAPKEIAQLVSQLTGTATAKAAALAAKNMSILPDELDENGILKVPFPTVTYNYDMINAGGLDAAKYTIKFLGNFFGTDSVIPNSDVKSVYRGVKGMYKYAVKGDYWAMNGMNKGFMQIHKYGYRYLFETTNRLQELAEATDLSVIPEQWRAAFNKYIKKIQTHNMRKLGYDGIYHDIEGAYNIYKLSKSPMAQAIGLEKISPLMPVQFLDEMASITGLDVTEDLLSRVFWDSMPEYIPLYLNFDYNVFASSPTLRFVGYPMNRTDIVKRYQSSNEFRKSLAAHEFGHAKDVSWGAVYGERWRDSAKWNKLFDDFAAIVNQDGGVKIQDLINKYEHDMMNTPNGWRMMTATEKELLGVFTDTMQAMVFDHRELYEMGHFGGYFNSRENQIAEFIAHASEIYWYGNEPFKQLWPELYEAMRAMVEEFSKSQLNP